MGCVDKPFRFVVVVVFDSDARCADKGQRRCGGSGTGTRMRTSRGGRGGSRMGGRRRGICGGRGGYIRGGSLCLCLCSCLWEREREQVLREERPSGEAQLDWHREEFVGEHVALVVVVVVVEVPISR